MSFPAECGLTAPGNWHQSSVDDFSQSAVSAVVHDTRPRPPWCRGASRGAGGQNLRRQACRLSGSTFRVLVQRVARDEHARLKSRHHHGRACRSQADVAGLIDSPIVPVNECAGAAIAFGGVFQKAHFTPRSTWIALWRTRRLGLVLRRRRQRTPTTTFAICMTETSGSYCASPGWPPMGQAVAHATILDRTAFKIPPSATFNRRGPARKGSSSSFFLLPIDATTMTEGSWPEPGPTLK